MKKQFRVCLLILVFLPVPLRSQRNDIQFDHLSTEDGLSQDIVNSIVQDHPGFMWFGTEDGLNRYDGYGIHVYKHNPRDSHSLSGDWIKDLFVDRERRLWIVSNAGLNLYNPDREQFIRIKHNLHSPSGFNTIGITSVCQDSSGTIWVVAEDGIHRLDERSNSLIEPPPNSIEFKSGIKIKRLFVDRHGTIWAGTTMGLYNVDIAHQSIIVNKKDVSRFSIGFGGSINDIVEDQHGNLWIATADSGIIQINAARGTRIHYLHQQNKSQSLSSDNILCLCIDVQGRLWSGTFEALDLYDSKTDGFVHYLPDSNDPSSLLGSRIYKIYTDRTGVLWVGTYRGGINRFDPLKRRFFHYRHRQELKESLSHDEVSCIAGDRNGHIWIGTEAGLDQFDRDAQRFLHIIDGNKKLGGEAIFALECRSDGTLWVGTGRGDLYLIDSAGRIIRTFLTLRDNKSLLGEQAIKALYETSDGMLWIGTTQAGLMCLDTHDWKMKSQPFTKTDMRFGLGVWVIHQDRSGTLWFGGFGGFAHLVKYTPRTGETFQYPAVPTGPGSISIPNARAIYEDSTGTLWIGTWGGGVIRFNPISNDFAVLTEQDGLSNNFVKGILADAHGRLWISTERGLTRYDPTAKTFKRFTTEDGLQGDRFLSGSFCQGSDGWMYFGGEKGFNAFHPDSVRDNSYIPPVAITNFSVLGHSTLLERTVDGKLVARLDYDQDYFSFEFVALNYTQVQNNQYAYMIEGFDRGWVQSGTRRYAAYTHLDGGTYTFRAKASNNDGVWNEVGTSVLVIINPPYWKTWWFYSIIVTMVSMMLYSIYRYRLKRVVEMERLRTRIASDLHDELASNLTSIAMFGTIIQNEPEVKQVLPERMIPLLDRITVLSQDSITAIRDIIWAIDPRNETLNSLLQRLIDAVTAECRARNIQFIVERPPEFALPLTNLTPEQRKHLWLILKEAIHNALKHSQCTSITVIARYEDSILTLSVTDNGCGIGEQPFGTGKGLHTMRMRAEQLGGNLSLIRKTPSGTTVELRLRF